MRQLDVTVTTNAAGAATAYTDDPVNGRVVTVIYTKTDFANGVDFTITGERTGQTVWTQQDVDATATVSPRQATHSTAGVAALYAANGEAVLDYVWLPFERIKVVIGSGGAAKTGKFTFVVDG